MRCPVCRSSDAGVGHLHALDCGGFDNSKLYRLVRLVCCSHCGHVFNELSQTDLNGLSDYYETEYAPANLNAGNIDGDRPGSASSLTSDRYGHLYSVLAPHIQSQYEILDVGCAVGGFLDFLGERGFSRLSGVDTAEVYVKQGREKGLYRIEYGNAESLPFADHAFDVIVMEQILEHVVDPVKAFQEARRTLKTNGILCVGVPDASRYTDCYFFDFYWILLREHIQHFDMAHLRGLAMQEGFEMLECRETAHAVMSDRMIMPNLCAVFRTTDRTAGKGIAYQAGHNLKQQMTRYVDQEKARQLARSRRMFELMKSQRPVYAWGIGREFFYLYESAGLKECNVVGLVDKNKFKQEKCTVNRMRIVCDDVMLRNASADSVLLITAMAHADSIRTVVDAIGFRGEILDLKE